MEQYQVGILGGGLAGLTAAIHLAQHGVAVLLIEKYRYPHHKVCGEYVSNEVLPYLTHLGIDVFEEGAVDIRRLQLSTSSGQCMEVGLPLGGFGMSRYHFDHLLYQRARDLGVTFCFDVVTDVRFEGQRFTVKNASEETFVTSLVLGAFGKRSLLDKKLQRDFLKVKSPWLGVKCHYKHEDFPNDLVALYSFSGGYGGLSKTETGNVNFCYLVTYNQFQHYGDLSTFQEEHLMRQPQLKSFFEQSNPVFDTPLSIGQISFAPKKPIENHLLMIGDSAGMIHPLCGNGMAMAIHSAQLASDCCIDFLKGEQDRFGMEKRYAKMWGQHFNRRLYTGRVLQRFLMAPLAASIAMNSLAHSKKLVRAMIRQTHGKPILV